MLLSFCINQTTAEATVHMRPGTCCCTERCIAQHDCPFEVGMFGVLKSPGVCGPGEFEWPSFNKVRMNSPCSWEIGHPVAGK